MREEKAWCTGDCHLLIKTQQTLDYHTSLQALIKLIAFYFLHFCACNLTPLTHHDDSPEDNLHNPLP